MTTHSITPHTAGQMLTVAAATPLLQSGRMFSVAGDEALLRQLPRGTWIGGTTPYFMGPQGGETSRDKVFVTELPEGAASPTLKFYDVTSLDQLCVEAPENGYSILIIPAFTQVHSLYARNAPEFENMFLAPIVGWISGVHLDDLGKVEPKVINGLTGEFDTDRALVMHVPLPPSQHAQIDIINLFSPGQGDRIRFEEGGFTADRCFINDQPAHLSDYIRAHGIDTHLPLVADYCGAMINVSIQQVDEAKQQVHFYAPVFPDIEYAFAQPVPHYEQAFNAVMPAHARHVAWSCNCVLNYLYSGLEGKKTGPFTGPVTFGEIAYQLVNQTLVYMTIETTG